MINKKFFNKIKNPTENKLFGEWMINGEKLKTERTDKINLIKLEFQVFKFQVYFIYIEHLKQPQDWTPKHQSASQKKQHQKSNNTKNM